MSAQVLGYGMHDEVGAKIQWVLQVRRCKRIINAYQDLLWSGKCGNGCYVYNIHQRIGWRFQPYQLCVTVDVLLDVAGIMHINIMEFNPELFKDLGEESVGTTIHIISTNDFVAGL